MRVATTTVALSIACGLTFVSLSAQEQPTQPGRGTPPVQTPTQPGQGSKPSQPGTQPGSPSQMATANREVSFTGCVTRGTPAGGSGGQQGGEVFLLSRARPASGAGAAAASGVGSRTQSSQSPSQSQSGASSQGAAGMGQQYRLVAQGNSVNLSNHVNHQVRVTGTLMNAGAAASAPSGANRSQSGAPDSSTPASPRGVTPGSATGVTGEDQTNQSGQSGQGQAGRPMGQGSTPSTTSAAQMPTLHVTQLTMVSATCEK